MTLCDRPGGPTDVSKHRCWGYGGLSVPGSQPDPGGAAWPPRPHLQLSPPLRRCSPSRNGSPWLGFLAGYTGLTREAYALDLRQYASWCQLDLLRTGQRASSSIRGCVPFDIAKVSAVNTVWAKARPKGRRGQGGEVVRPS